MKVSLFFLIIPLLNFSSMFASPIIFVSQENFSKKIKICSTKNQEKEFLFETIHFKGPDSFPGKEITKLSEEHAKLRFSQLECLRNLNLLDNDLVLLKKSYTFFRERELEGLEILSNYFISQDKKNMYAPGELSKIKGFLKLKNELYYILSKKTEDYLFLGEKIELNDFISIYQSMLRLHYDLLNSVPKIVRQNFIKK